MRSSIFVSAVAFAVASAQSDSSSIDAFPQTSLLKMTNSLGVVTGQPAAATSQAAAVTSQPKAVTEQPAAVTSQPLPDNIPAVGTGIHTLTLAGTGSAFNETRTVVVSANNSTTQQVATSTAEASGSGAEKSGSTKSGSSKSASGTGAAEQSEAAAVPNVKVAAGSIVGFGAFMAAFL